MSSVSSAHSLLFCWLLTPGHVVSAEPPRGSSSLSPSSQEHSRTGPGGPKFYQEKRGMWTTWKAPTSHPTPLTLVTPELKSRSSTSLAAPAKSSWKSCLSLHTRKSQFPTGNASFGVDSTLVLHQSTPCPRSRAITAWEASATPSRAYCAPSSLRKMHLCVQLLCSTDNELSPN